MSQERPDRPGTANFLAALNVERNAKVAFGLAFLLAAALVVLVVRAPQGQYPTVYYLGLGFVLTVGVGILLTVVFTLASAYRLARAT